MVFSSSVFLFVFLPFVSLAYLAAECLERHGPWQGGIKKLRLKDLVLVAFSMAFYLWSCFDHGVQLVIYILLVYGAARLIEISRGSFAQISTKNKENSVLPKRRFYVALIPFVIAILAVVFCLIYFKYSQFLASTVNSLFHWNLEERGIWAPLGISFITFSTISYLTDIYRGNASSGSLLDCTLFLSFFPKVVSGPIVLWKEFQPQMKNRTMSVDCTISGFNRIIIGLAKKVLLADQFGAALGFGDFYGKDPITALGTILLYTLQIYYDFSGYSDIAIGLCTLFGF